MNNSPYCPICHSRITTLYYRENRVLPVKSFSPSASDFGIYYALYRCQGCHAVFASDLLSAMELSKIYQASRHDGYMLEEKSRRINFQHLAKALARYLDPSQSIDLLDVGSSVGLFLDTVRRLYPHWTLAGIEASKSAVETCEKLYHFKLKQGMFETADIPLNSQDVVTMLDLIEHVRKPMAIIEAANRSLKTSGLLVITTPNIESWTARLFQKHWWSFRLMHTLYFSPLSMRQMLARGGFRVVKMRGLIRLFSLRYCLRHLGWTIKGPSITLPFPLSLGDMLVIARKEIDIPQ